MLSTYQLFENRIIFPQEEVPNILERLNKGLDVKSVRVYREFNKYKPGETYKTPWGEDVVVTDIRKLTNIKRYEHYNELTPHMKSQIGNTRNIDILTIKSKRKIKKQSNTQRSNFNNDHWYRINIKPGISVSIVKKEHQKSGQLTKGIVLNILTSKPKHTRGIKVRLQSGDIGRVQRILK